LSADLSLIETGPATMKNGNPAAFTITLTNNGPDPAQNVVLSNTVSGITPGQFSGSFVPAAGNPDSFTFSTANGGATAVETATGDIPAGHSNVFISTITTHGVSDGTVVTNTANVTSTTPDPTTNDNISVVNTTVVPPSANLSVIETGPATMKNGNPAVFTITLTNNGPDPAQNVVLSNAVSGITTAQFSGRPRLALRPCLVVPRHGRRGFRKK
jgi:uncharacterized repeat protein (TIGR01451 family)